MDTTTQISLFEPFRTGDLRLSNRIEMAPMTRSRAIGSIPNDLMATYYAQRASAGLIITEGVAPSPNGLGYDRESAEDVLDEGRADLVSFGTPFISNPDFPKRMAEKIPLTEPDKNTFYSPGEKGFTDYSFSQN